MLHQKLINYHGSLLNITHVPIYSSELGEAQESVTRKPHLTEEQKRTSLTFAELIVSKPGYTNLKTTLRTESQRTELTLPFIGPLANTSILQVKSNH